MPKPICSISRTGTKTWRINGVRHREDGPALECASGTKIWYHNGKYHRIDGPAYEFADGCRYWYHFGVCHREDGPAIEYADGHKEWVYHGRAYSTIDEFCTALQMTEEEKTIFLLKWAI